MLKSEKKVLDLKIGDHLVEIDLDSSLDYQQALIVAMKAEKAAYKLYNDLASTTDDPTVKALFLSLAQEEAKHKLRFEIEYDEVILTEN
jgi:rubrerythrin